VFVWFVCLCVCGGWVGCCGVRCWLVGAPLCCVFWVFCFVCCGGWGLRCCRQIYHRRRSFRPLPWTGASRQSPGREGFPPTVKFPTGPVPRDIGRVHTVRLNCVIGIAWLVVIRTGWCLCLRRAIVLGWLFCSYPYMTEIHSVVLNPLKEARPGVVLLPLTSPHIHPQNYCPDIAVVKRLPQTSLACLAVRCLVHVPLALSSSPSSHCLTLRVLVHKRGYSSRTGKTTGREEPNRDSRLHCPQDGFALPSVAPGASMSW